MNAQREILQQVAAGELSPEEGAARLEEIESREASPVEAPSGPVEAVRVTGTFRTIKIVGDPSVHQAVVEGPHTAHRDGATLVVDAEEHVEGEGVREFSFSKRGGSRVVLGLGSKPLPLTIRMRPDLPLDVELAAGALKVEDVKGTIRAQVSAGAIKIDGFASPIDLQVSGGTVKASGVLNTGESRIVCEAGTVKVTLEPGSSVRVTGKAGLGKVVLPGDGDKGVQLIGGGARERVIGDGAGRLEVEASMGVVAVETR